MRDFYLISLATECQSDQCDKQAEVDLREKGEGSHGKFCLECAQKLIREWRSGDRNRGTLVKRVVAHQRQVAL